MRSTFSDNLKRFRVAKHYTQEQAAEVFGVSPQSVSRWECGTTLPDVTMLPKIAETYCVTIDDLYRASSVAYDNYAQRLGSVYEATRAPEDFHRADQEYQKLLRSGEATSEDYRLYGILHQYMMRYCMEKAEELFDQVLEKGSAEDADAYWRTRRQKLYLYMQLGRGEEAIAAQKAVIDSGSDCAEEWGCMIAAYLLAGQYDRAWEWFQQTLERFPATAEIYVYGGDICMGLHQYGRALEYWDRALALDPGFCDANYSKGFCYEQMGEFEKAHAVWMQLADDLEKRGYDAEVTYPRMLARKCKEKITP